ncbi:DUF1996 domain-containing protein [Saccharothrix sp. Mg75]|uniref:DUF1996 domain-containing protein n=1 Tax=Saccharothrix sp. Mg75 TaxID=3445357 RepID=UPI003EF077F4
MTALAVTGSAAVYVTSTFAATAPPAQPLLSQGRQATSSSTEAAAFGAAKAVDGDPGTRWSSAFRDPQWLQVDLGSTASISKVTLAWERAHALDYQLQSSSDGLTWTTFDRVANSPGGTESHDVTATGRYVRVHATKRSTQYGVSLWEFQVFGTAGPTTTTPPASATTGVPTTSSPSATTSSTTAVPTTTAPTTTAPGTTSAGPTTSATIPPNAVRVAEFVAECPFTHRLPDDPIVFPKLSGASHMHSFFGNESTDAHSDVNSLSAARSTCSPSVDVSSYWVPTLYVDGQPVEPTGTTFYYLGEGVKPEVTARIQPFPLGLRVVAGNARATAPDATTLSRWSCLHAGHVGSSKDFVNCPAGTMLESYLDFPQCWNGKDLDAPDHKSHMSYPVDGGCPATHPVPVPKLRQVLRYPVSGDPSRIRLASGAGFTMHGDFFNAWPEAELAQRVRDCINVIVKCGPNGRP